MTGLEVDEENKAQRGQGGVEKPKLTLQDNGITAVHVRHQRLVQIRTGLVLLCICPSGTLYLLNFHFLKIVVMLLYWCLAVTFL